MDLSESETGSEEVVTGKPVAYKTVAGEPHASSKSDYQGGPKAERTEWSHHPHVSPVTIHHAEAVFSIVRGIYGRETADNLEDLENLDLEDLDNLPLAKSEAYLKCPLGQVPG